jgi:hypothetical protein
MNNLYSDSEMSQTQCKHHATMYIEIEPQIMILREHIWHIKIEIIVALIMSICIYMYVQYWQVNYIYM